MHPRRTVLGLVAAAALALAALPATAAGLVVPIPPGPADLTVPSFAGSAVVDRPIASPTVPRHPFLAPPGTNSMHNDAYATDAYAGGGPRGVDLRVSSATYGVEECATLTFAADGRIVALCGNLQGPNLRLIDPDTLESLASFALPGRKASSTSPLQDLCGGAYFYLDQRGRAVVETTDGHIWVVARTGDAFRLVKDYDVTSALPTGDCLIALLPDWSGRIWFVTQEGGVGTVDRTSGRVRSRRLPGERIVNSFATDETGGVFVVSDHALYRFDAGRTGAPRVTWRRAYDRGSVQKPGQLSQGSGTTPTLVGSDLVVITDNADPRMRVVSYRRDTGRRVCSVPVFAPGASATENSIIAVGGSVIAENNYGYGGPQQTVLGASSTPGLARVGVTRRNCGPLWTSQETAPSSVAKVSLRTGLLYAYTKPPGVTQDPWYLTAVDVRTGRTAWRRLTGTGPAWNNHYAAIYLGPDRALYVATLVGLVRIADAP